MPITVKVVSEEVYADWLKGAIEEYADAGTSGEYQIAALN